MKMKIWKNRRKKRWATDTLLHILLAFMVFAITGCATIGPKGPTYPTDAKAKRHYVLGDSYLTVGAYEKAALEFRRSIEIESEPFLSHARLATAYYAQQKYYDAASAFKRATDLSGGPRDSGPLTIMQILSIMRGGNTEDAEALLKELSGPDMMALPTGVIYVGAGKLTGIWKTAAGYLLETVSEADYLQRAPQHDLSFPYLIIGINNVVEENSAKAHESLSKALDLAGRGTWRRVIAKAELDLLSQKTVERPLAQVVYDDCMPVQVNEFKEEVKDNPEMLAHLACEIISGICRDDPSPGGEECRKGIVAYDQNRKDSGPSELYRAAEAGNANLVTQLLGIGFNPDSPLGGPGWTPLMIASANGHQGAVFSLLSYGCEVNATNDKGRTALMFASRYGYDSIVKALLKEGASVNLISKDEPKWPALTAASFNGHSKTVSILLEHGADAEIKDEMGMTAYSWAEKEGRKDVLKVFQQKGY